MLAMVQRQACASAAEPMATAVVRCGRCEKAKRRQRNEMRRWESRARAGASIGALWLDVACAVRMPVTRGAKNLNRSGTVASIQLGHLSLTVILHDDKYFNPLIISKNSLNESRSPSSHLQLLLKDQGLNLNRCRVKSCQS